MQSHKSTSEAGHSERYCEDDIICEIHGKAPSFCQRRVFRYGVEALSQLRSFQPELKTAHGEKGRNQKKPGALIVHTDEAEDSRFRPKTYAGLLGKNRVTNLQNES